MLKHKKILLGITGGIAAYKACELVRRLKDEGAIVRVVMTKGAQAFVSPLTLQALSGEAVHTDLLDTHAEAAMGHIELAKWADAIVIAPTSADFIAKLSCGMADDLLSTLCLASTAKLAIAPAMNQAMWHHYQTQTNIQHLLANGVRIWGPAQGTQACGDTGFGRMLETTQIIAHCHTLFSQPILAGKHFVITAGPTREALDPVRYISNHSSGKMGYALAQAAAELGATVSLISGPVNLTTPNNVQRINVQSAQQMLEASLAQCQNADIFIACAAVADYRVKTVATQKIKKSAEKLTLELERNEDIVQTIAALQTHRPFVVGFAAETENVIPYAQDKLLRKNLDLIVANDVSQSAIGFNSDENEVNVINAQGVCAHIPRCSKHQLAQQLVQYIAQQAF